MGWCEANHRAELASCALAKATRTGRTPNDHDGLSTTVGSALKMNCGVTVPDLRHFTYYGLRKQIIGISRLDYIYHHNRISRLVSPRMVGLLVRQLSLPDTTNFQRAYYIRRIIE